MIIANHLKGLVLAIHPTAKGFAWVLFENPQTPVAWSIVHAGAGREQRVVSRFKRLLERYEPGILVLESFEEGITRRSPRIRRLCEEMLHIARAHNMDAKVFSRDVVQSVFSETGAVTRVQIAQVIADRVDAFSHRLPQRRRAWQSDDPRQSLFDAAALALTYYAVMNET